MNKAITVPTVAIVMCAFDAVVAGADGFGATVSDVATMELVSTVIGVMVPTFELQSAFDCKAPLGSFASSTNLVPKSVAIDFILSVEIFPSASALDSFFQSPLAIVIFASKSIFTDS